MVILRDDVQSLAALPRPSRVTLVRSGALGDTILLLPAVELVRRALPGLELTLAGSRWARDLCPLMPHPWKTVPFGSVELTSLFLPDAEGPLPPSLSEADLVVVYSGRPGDAFAANVRRLRGGKRTMRWPVHPQAGAHAAAHFAAALTCGMPAPHELPPPELRAPPVQAGERPPVVIHPGSGGQRKCWPAPSYAALIGEISARGRRVVMLEGPADRPPCRAVLDLLPGRQRPAVERPENLRELATLLAGALLYAGNDSGPTHLAAALGTPTVAVFGPTDPAVWAPLGRRVKAINAPGGWPGPGEVLRVVLDAVC